MKKAYLIISAVLLSVVANAAVVTWDGGGTDNNWQTAANWSTDTLPAGNDTVQINSDDTVNLDTEWPANPLEINLDGTMTQNGAMRLWNTRLNVGATATNDLTGNKWLVLWGGGTEVSFDSGATFIQDSGRIQFADNADQTLGFNLDAGGFQTLSANLLHFDGYAGQTIKVDMADYTGMAGTTIVLMDLTGNNGLTDTIFQNDLNPVVANAGVYASSTLQWNETTSAIELVIPGGGGAYEWDGGGSDDNWNTAANWNYDEVPGASDAVVIGSSYTVTNAQQEFASLTIATNSTVLFGEDGLPAASTVTNAGTIKRTGVWRLSGGGTITLTGTGSFGSGITWLDLQGADLNFQDGASFASRASLEHRSGNTFGFTLSETGFTTLELGTLWPGGTTWADATYTIDISAYNSSNGTTITLMDFTGSSMGGTFDPSANSPTVNINAGASGLGSALTFDTDTYDLILTIDPPGNDLPVADDQTISVSTNGPTAFTLVATDPEGSNLTYTIVDAPAYGELAGTAPDLTYTATGGVFVLDSFTFTAFDGEDTSNTGTVTVAFIPNTQAELWSTYHSAICSDVLNTEWLTNWTEGAISMYQIRYELGSLSGTRTNATPKVAAYYAYPTGGTDLPGLLQIHGGGQRGSASLAKYWAEQGYATISINWGGLPLEDGLSNTDWDGLPAGFVRDGVANAVHHNWADPDTYSDGATLYDVVHPLNSSWILNAYAARRALTFLSSLAYVDTNKLGVTGWSMGGRTTVLTSTDPRITCVTPGVGGSGFLYEDWWGLSGTARNTNGVGDVALYGRTAGAESYWPHITCPLLFHEAANDYNAPFDLVTRAMALQPTNVSQRLAISPHFNHRVGTPSYAAKVLWQKTHLAGGFDFPETAQAELDLTQSDGIPRFRVWPDTSTSATIESVDIYYGIERDSRIRFWRDAGAVQAGGYWEATCPVYDTNEMFVAVGIVTYGIDFDLAMPPGLVSPTRSFAVASEVTTVYPVDLASNGVVATATQQQQIDDFTRGYHDWYSLDQTNPHHWQHWTRKVGDPSWRGRDGTELAMDVETTAPGNSLGITLITEQWGGGDANTYSAVVSLPVSGTNSISVAVGAFTNGLGAALTTWEEANQLALRPGDKVDDGLANWSGDTPTFSDLRWEGGPYAPRTGSLFTLW